MRAWPRRPVIYEINTWVWLYELSEKYSRSVTLATVPKEEWDAIGSYRFDAVWLMGVWERSPSGIAISMKNKELLSDFRHALPDFIPQDNVGSPYCIRRYVVDRHLGGPNGLAHARRMLAVRGMRLILDFVPNHVAPDHPWVKEHPEYFVQGSSEELIQKPAEFIRVEDNILARGRDPYFPPWQDVVQLNAFLPALRQAAISTVLDIADQCDGMRCDMAMLMMNPIFERTWGSRAGSRLRTDYWPDLITAVRKRHPGVLFIAEAYWDLEWELQQQGFDYCYDKRLYDRLEHDSAESVRLHLCANPAYQNKLVRFIENHDEPRAAAAFPARKAVIAAVVCATLSGARLFHEGQFDGRRVKLPVFLRRRPKEVADRAMQEFYTRLLHTLRERDFKDGDWTLCERTGWPENDSYRNVVAWCWAKGSDRHLIVVNLSDTGAQARVVWPWPGFAGRRWRLSDPVQTVMFERSGDELERSGLYVDLEPYGFHFLKIEGW
jgi:hypothetical protein